MKMEVDGASMSFSTNIGVVQARLLFNEQGRIARVMCGPEDSQIAPRRTA